MASPRICVVAGARPNFMKVAPLLSQLDEAARVDFIHTGQHYDDTMSRTFFRDLGLRDPDVNFGVGSGTHAEQTARVLVACEQRLDARPADAVVVVGDVNSTLACALAAAKLGLPVAHVEAGLRSHDWSMPEEINRVLTDRLSRWLFTPSMDADANLAREGIPPERVHCIGNVMIDSLRRVLPAARRRGPELRRQLSINEGEYAVLTLHRPSNVDADRQLERIFAAIRRIATAVPVVFPVHPRTGERLARAGIDVGAGVMCVEPLGYRDFLALVDSARLVLTDSGGLQEETSHLGIPCLTLRASTERPITCTLGTNQLVGVEPEAILAGFHAALVRPRSPARIPGWDGHAGGRVAAQLLADLASPVAE